jgi:hypothetical protein
MSIKIKFQNLYLRVESQPQSTQETEEVDNNIVENSSQKDTNSTPKKRNVLQKAKDFINKKIDDQEFAKYEDSDELKQQISERKKYRNPNGDTIFINKGTLQSPENNDDIPSTSSPEKASSVSQAQIENIVNSTNTLSAEDKKRIIEAGIGDLKPELLSEIIKKSGGFFKFTKFFRDAKNIELKSSLTKEQQKVIGQTNKNDKLEAELVRTGYTQVQIDKIMAPIRELEDANSSLSIDQVNKQLDERDLLLQTVLKKNGGLNLVKQGINALSGGLAATTIGLGFVGSAFASTLGDKWLGNKEKRNELDAIGSLEAGKFDAGMQKANMLMQNIIALESAGSIGPIKNPEYISSVIQLKMLLQMIEKASISQKAPLSLESFTQFSKITKALESHKFSKEELEIVPIENINRQEIIDLLNSDRARVETSTNEAINNSMQKLWSKETLIGLTARLALGATISSVAHAVPHIKGENLLGVDNQHFAHAADKIQRNGRKLAQENFAQGIDINNPIFDKFADFGGWVNQRTQDIRINLFEGGGYKGYMDNNALTGELSLDGVKKYFGGEIPAEIAKQLEPLQAEGMTNFRIMKPTSAFKEKFDQILAGSMGGLFGLTANFLPRSKMVNPIYQAGTMESMNFSNPDIAPKSPDLPPNNPPEYPVDPKPPISNNKDNILPFRQNQHFLNPSKNNLLEGDNNIYDGELLEPTKGKPKLKGYKTPDDILDGEVIDDNKAINGGEKLMISGGKEQNQNPEIQKLLAAEKKAVEDNNIEAYKTALGQRYILEGKPRDMRLLTPAVFEKITGKSTPPLQPKTERVLITPTTESDDPWVTPIENLKSKELSEMTREELADKLLSITPPNSRNHQLTTMIKTGIDLNSKITNIDDLVSDDFGKSNFDISIARIIENYDIETGENATIAKAIFDEALRREQNEAKPLEQLSKKRLVDELYKISDTTGKEFPQLTKKGLDKDLYYMIYASDRDPTEEERIDMESSVLKTGKIKGEENIKRANEIFAAIWLQKRNKQTLFRNPKLQNQKTGKTQASIDDTITAEILEPLPSPEPKQIGQEQDLPIAAEVVVDQIPAVGEKLLIDDVINGEHNGNTRPKPKLRVSPKTEAVIDAEIVNEELTSAQKLKLLSESNNSQGDSLVAMIRNMKDKEISNFVLESITNVKKMGAEEFKAFKDGLVVNIDSNNIEEVNALKILEQIHIEAIAKQTPTEQESASTESKKKSALQLYQQLKRSRKYRR